jgi:hypothetical protein
MPAYTFLNSPAIDNLLAFVIASVTTSCITTNAMKNLIAGCAIMIAFFGAFVTVDLDI